MLTLCAHASKRYTVAQMPDEKEVTGLVLYANDSLVVMKSLDGAIHELPVARIKRLTTPLYGVIALRDGKIVHFDADQLWSKSQSRMLPKMVKRYPQVFTRDRQHIFGHIRWADKHHVQIVPWQYNKEIVINAADIVKLVSVNGQELLVENGVFVNFEEPYCYTAKQLKQYRKHKKRPRSFINAEREANRPKAN